MRGPSCAARCGPCAARWPRATARSSTGAPPSDCAARPTFRRSLAFAAAGEVAEALALCRGPLLAGLDEHAWVLAARAEHAVRVAALREQVGIDDVRAATGGG